MLSVAHNLTAYNAVRQYNLINNSRAKSVEKLSSGYKVNRAADDAASLAISEKMRRQVRGLTQASLNCQDGISLNQVKDGALNEVHDILNRMNELSVKAANDPLTNEDRHYIQEEMNKLVSEINRIGSDTTFNHIQVFDYANQMGITSTPSSSAIGSGYLTDVYPENGMYYPSANLDFSGINADTVSDLYGNSFSFTCSVGCPEAFKFTFINGDGTQSSASNLHGTVEHRYVIDIGGETTPKGVLDKLFNCVYNNMPTGTNCSARSVDDMDVSHSNRMVRTSDSSFSLVAKNGYSTPEQAAQKFANAHGKYGQANCTEIASVISSSEFKPVLKIQAGAESGQYIYLTMETMNAKVLGLDPTDVSTQGAAASAIEKIKSAFTEISEQRSRAGAEQNRLEHTIRNLDNIVENTTAAESQIRDTDMAKQMVELSLKNILAQAGESMMSQANQSNQGVLSLLK